MSRPSVSVYSADGKSVGSVKFPAVFEAPIRLDVVQHVHRDISKNHRQPYAVSERAGHQTSAESWGTGRAVARIPRVPGGGTHRAGQAAFGNMCRGGRMFAPTKTYRRWHRKVNKNQRRYAIVSALAASGSTALVIARGHRIDSIPEIPLVIQDQSIVDLEKTSQAVSLLKGLHAYEDVVKSKDSKKIRAGKGKSRNRRYVQRRGPLVIYDQASKLKFAFRNLPGVELCSVNRLNLLQLAPGGHLGRFILWTKGAFARLDALYGSYRRASAEKVGYRLPRPLITNSDLGRLINSQEVQSHLRAKRNYRKFPVHKKNPLKNLGHMIKLNPYHKSIVRKEVTSALFRKKKKADFIASRRQLRKEGKLEALIKAKKTEKEERRKKKVQARKDLAEKAQKDGKKRIGRMNPHKKSFVKRLHK